MALELAEESYNRFIMVPELVEGNYKRTPPFRRHFAKRKRAAKKKSSLDPLRQAQGPLFTFHLVAELSHMVQRLQVEASLLA